MQSLPTAHSPSVTVTNGDVAGPENGGGVAGLGKVEKVPSRTWGDREHRWRAGVRLALLVWGQRMGRGQSPQLSEHSGQAWQAHSSSHTHTVSPPRSGQPLPSGKDL